MPYESHQLSTIFLRVPTFDWAAIKRGVKREFRAQPGRVSGLRFVEPPTPVVAYSWRSTTGHDAQLMVLEKRWQEPLGAISAESLEAEGYESVEHFRRAWMEKTHRRFRLNQVVTVYRVRQFDEDDKRMLGDRMMEKLYGPFLPSA